MDKRIWLSAVLAATISTAWSAGTETKEVINTGPGGGGKPAVGDPVANSQFVWSLFVQAMTPANGSLTFESWAEQCDLNPKLADCTPASGSAAEGKKRTLHGSALARAARLRAGSAVDASQEFFECSPMQTTALGNIQPPTNLSSKPQFCEEVFVDSTEAAFVKQNGLTTLTGQLTYAKANGGAITFPWTAVEIKADWVAPSSFQNPTFQCPDPTNKLYTETIDGTCYALVGLHISSKALPDWLWATFEPASSITNPNRCNPQLYSTCFDPWGTTSKVPYGKGTTVPQSPQLQQLMASANLNKAFSNYYLTGVQTQFVDKAGKPIPLGSSFVEFNAGVLPGQASCITCHKYAYYDGKPVLPGHVENNFGGPPTGWAAVGYACNQPNATGNCTPVTAGSISQDFSWMLGLMPYK